MHVRLLERLPDGRHFYDRPFGCHLDKPVDLGGVRRRIDIELPGPAAPVQGFFAEFEDIGYGRLVYRPGKTDCRGIVLESVKWMTVLKQRQSLLGSGQLEVCIRTAKSIQGERPCQGRSSEMISIRPLG